MNIARVIEIDGAPTLLVYGKTHGTHSHTDIDHATNRETGRCTSVRFEGERMPASGESTVAWLICKTQEALGATIDARPWDGGIDIMQVHTSASLPQQDFATA